MIALLQIATIFELETDMNKLGIRASTRAFVSGMSSAFEIAPKTRVLVVKKAKYSGYEQDSNSFASDMKAIGSDFNTAIKRVCHE